MTLTKRLRHDARSLLSEDYFGYHLVELVSLAFLACLITVAAYFGMRPLLARLDATDQALAQFLYERSFVQWVTVCVFCFGLLLVFDRSLTVFILSRSLKRLRRSTTPEPDLSGPIRSRMNRVRSVAVEQGERSAAELNTALLARETAQLDRVHGLLRDTTQLLLGLGFFGTVLGISRLFTTSFAEESQGLTGFSRFTGGLSIALDTSVLAMSLGIVLTLTTTAIAWTEINTLHALDREICGRLGIGATVPRREADA